MKKIVLYGDSNTWGYRGWDIGKRLPRDQRFEGHIAKAFPQYEVVAEGLPGRNLSFPHPIETNTNGMQVLPTLLTTHDPIDLVVIMLGTNDSMTILSNSLFNIRYAMEKTIQLIQAPDRWAIDRMEAPKILLVAPPMISHVTESPYYGQYDERSVEMVAGLPEAYRKLSGQYGCGFVDGSFIQPSGMDGVHLNAQEHALLAEKIIAEMKTMGY